MWISILNYGSGQIEIHDLTEYANAYCSSKYAKGADCSDDNIVDSWLSEKDYNLDIISYMVTDEAPEIYNGNTQTVIDIPL